jgi:hypothetical protein
MRLLPRNRTRHAHRLPVRHHGELDSHPLLGMCTLPRQVFYIYIKLIEVRESITRLWVSKFQASSFDQNL